MRKVVTELNWSELVMIDAISDKSIIGIQWQSGGKSMIVQHKDEKFSGMDVKNLSLMHNGVTYSKIKYIESALRQDADIYEFESYIELYKWILGQ